jgi:hypothetical protein
MNDKNLTQTSGDGSENYQAGLNLTVYKAGLSIEEAKQVLMLLMEQNFIKFSEQALEVAKKRVEEMTTNYLNGLAAKNPSLIENVQEPGIQMALLAAQKEYVKTGDKHLADLLTKILIERTSQSPRTLLQISLDEGLTAIGKLTNNQINVILLNLIMSSIVKPGIKSLVDLKAYFNFYVRPVSKLIKIGGMIFPILYHADARI